MFVSTNTRRYSNINHNIYIYLFFLWIPLRFAYCGNFVFFSSSSIIILSSFVCFPLSLAWNVLCFMRKLLLYSVWKVAVYFFFNHILWSTFSIKFLDFRLCFLSFPFEWMPFSWYLVVLFVLWFIICGFFSRTKWVFGCFLPWIHCKVSMSDVSLTISILRLPSRWMCFSFLPSFLCLFTLMFLF